MWQKAWSSNLPMITSFRRESRVRSVAGKLSKHSFGQLAHDLALLGGDLFLHRGVSSLQELVVLFLSRSIITVRK